MAIILSIIENLIPRPLPWMRIGLSNAITLFAFTLLRPGEVFLLIISRILATSLLLGTFMSVTFFLSITGAFSSFLVMYAGFRWFKNIFSIVGISILGALSSNLSQLLVVNVIFINSRLSYYLVPFILLFALGGGVVTGLFAHFLCNNL